MSESKRRDKLIKASDHLYYEIGMFQALTRGMMSGIAGVGTINNAILESYAIHVRLLIHFFFDDSSQKDDVLASHYFGPQKQWKDIAPPYTNILKIAKKRADKEIAHLTYSRQKVTKEKKPWQFLPISNDLQLAINKFITSVPRELLGEQWQNIIIKQ
jgi:hypothetical protein